MLDRIKKINLKNIIKAFTLTWGLVLIIIMTITNLGLKQDFNFLDWLGNSLILFGIMVFGLLMGESIGGDKQREKLEHDEEGNIIGGLFQKSLSDYNKVRKSIDDIVIYFIQFFQWFMPQELRDKKINYLIASGVEETKAKNIVKYCDYSNFEELKDHPIQIENVIIRKLSDNEIEPIEKVLKGEIVLDANNPSYFLSAFGKNKSKSILEIGSQLDKDIRFNRTSNRILKIVVSLGISLAFGLLTVKEFMQGDDIQAWANLVSRITALFTSILSGWLSSVIDIKLKAQKLVNKMDVLVIFKNAYDKHLFVAKSEEELAKEELNKYKEEQEKSKQNIVDPEIVITPSLIEQK